MLSGCSTGADPVTDPKTLGSVVEFVGAKMMSQLNPQQDGTVTERI